MKQFYTSIGLMFLCLSTVAQTATQSIDLALSFEDYLQRVLDYSQELKQAVEGKEAATYQRKAVATGYLPKIDLSGNVSYDLMPGELAGRPIEPLNYTVGATLTQSLYVGGALQAQLRMAQADEEMAALSEQLSLDEVSYRAELMYWQTVAQQELLKNAENYYQVVGELFKVVDNRFDDGYVSKSDLLMVNTRLKEAELQRNSAERAASISCQQLNSLMGEDVGQSVQLTGDIHQLANLPEAKFLNDVLLLRPEYLLAEKNLEKQRFQLQSVASQYLPKIAVGLKGAWGTPIINLTGNAALNGTAYASFSFPLFHWGERNHATQAVKSQIRSLEWQKSSLSDHIEVELASAWLGVNDDFARIGIARENFLIANENLELTTLRYTEGLLPILDVMSSLLSWIQASNAVVQAEYSYKASLAAYRKACGGTN